MSSSLHFPGTHKCKSKLPTHYFKYTIRSLQSSLLSFPICPSRTKSNEAKGEGSERKGVFLRVESCSSLSSVCRWYLLLCQWPHAQRATATEDRGAYEVDDRRVCVWCMIHRLSWLYVIQRDYKNKDFLCRIISKPNDVCTPCVIMFVLEILHACDQTFWCSHTHNRYTSVLNWAGKQMTKWLNYNFDEPHYMLRSH